MDFVDILAAHAARYPQMEPQDYGKLAYQSEFGPEHMVSDLERAEAGIRQEWRSVNEGCSPESPEEIGAGVCRFPLSMVKDERDVRLLARLFVCTAGERPGSPEGLQDKLAQLRGLDVPGMEGWLAEYKATGCPAVHHSETFREAYHPHYRLVGTEFVKYLPVLREMEALVEQNRPVVIAIDGRCGSGKSSLAAVLQKVYPCNVVHMDDYYMPPEQREENWMEIPAGNMDLERFRVEVLEPIRGGEEVAYRPFHCQSGKRLEATVLPKRQVTIVEGSYSHHPRLAEYCDWKIFLTCSAPVQTRRLQRREGDYFPRFQKIWMPMEERYFRAFDIETNADMVVDTGKLFE